jgi:hypothetical protein
MTERTFEYPVESEDCSAKPAEQLAPWESDPPRSQGTDSVRGTWCSEGNAGCHLSCPRLLGMGHRARNRGHLKARISGRTRRASAIPAGLACGIWGCSALRMETGDAGCLAGRCQPDRMETCGPEEPDEGNLHVRICGEAGGESPRLYPDRAELNP